MSQASVSKTGVFTRPFFVLWLLEFWERFGYYGVQTILALYFVRHLGFTEKQGVITFGIFAGLIYGFVWIGGYIGDKFLGGRRTVALGAIILFLSYLALSFTTKEYVFYVLGGIIVGNMIFKANPSSLISKMYKRGDPALDGAMTMYYMAINLGALISSFATPIIANKLGWTWAFLLCAVGMGIGLLAYMVLYNFLSEVSTEAGRKPLSYAKLLTVLIGAAVFVVIFAQLLEHKTIADLLIVSVVIIGIAIFFYQVFIHHKKERARMLVALILMIEAAVFFVLYFQMPTALTFFALHNVNLTAYGFRIPAAEFQVLNPIIIVIASPLLVIFYKKVSSTHVTKFAIGMTLCSLAFLVLYLPRFFAVDGLISPLWMLITYIFQSVGELFVSGLGLAMVAELCPKNISGLVMGLFFIASMVAGPIAGWMSSKVAAGGGAQESVVASLNAYTNLFLTIGLITLGISILMWISSPMLNKIIRTKPTN